MPSGGKDSKPALLRPAKGDDVIVFTDDCCAVRRNVLGERVLAIRDLAQMRQYAVLPEDRLVAAVPIASAGYPIAVG